MFPQNTWVNSLFWFAAAQLVFTSQTLKPSERARKWPWSCASWNTVLCPCEYRQWKTGRDGRRKGRRGGHLVEMYIKVLIFKHLASGFWSHRQAWKRLEKQVRKSILSTISGLCTISDHNAYCAVKFFFKNIIIILWIAQLYCFMCALEVSVC